MDQEWFRRTSWTAKDREEFFARLKRSRGAYNKAQYARIQALYIAETRTQEGYLSALELLDMILADWKEEAQLAAVYDQRAECFQGLGDLQRAVEAYREVFKIQRVHRGHLTQAHLHFGWLVATTPLPDLFEEALAVLGEFGHDLFPVERYRTNAILALILNVCGQTDRARGYALDALKEAEAKYSGFRYHPKLGLVNSQDEEVKSILEALAKPAP